MVNKNQSHAKKISQSRPTHAGEARAAADDTKEVIALTGEGSRGAAARRGAGEDGLGQLWRRPVRACLRISRCCVRVVG